MIELDRVSLQFGILLISMTMFEVGILVYFQIKKSYLNDEFEQSLEKSLKMTENDSKYRKTWDFMQITVSLSTRQSPHRNVSELAFILTSSLNVVGKIVRKIGDQ